MTDEMETPPRDWLTPRDRTLVLHTNQGATRLDICGRSAALVMYDLRSLHDDHHAATDRPDD